MSSLVFSLFIVFLHAVFPLYGWHLLVVFGILIKSTSLYVGILGCMLKCHPRKMTTDHFNTPLSHFGCEVCKYFKEFHFHFINSINFGTVLIHMCAYSTLLFANVYLVNQILLIRLSRVHLDDYGGWFNLPIQKVRLLATTCPSNTPCTTCLRFLWLSSLLRGCTWYTVSRLTTDSQLNSMDDNNDDGDDD